MFYLRMVQEVAGSGCHGRLPSAVGRRPAIVASLDAFTAAGALAWLSSTRGGVLLGLSELQEAPQAIRRCGWPVPSAENGLYNAGTRRTLRLPRVASRRRRRPPVVAAGGPPASCHRRGRAMSGGRVEADVAPTSSPWSPPRRTASRRGQRAASAVDALPAAAERASQRTGGRRRPTRTLSRPRRALPASSAERPLGSVLRLPRQVRRSSQRRRQLPPSLRGPALAAASLSRIARAVCPFPPAVLEEASARSAANARPSPSRGPRPRRERKRAAADAPSSSVAAALAEELAARARGRTI